MIHKTIFLGEHMLKQQIGSGAFQVVVADYHLTGGNLVAKTEQCTVAM